MPTRRASPPPVFIVGSREGAFKPPPPCALGQGAKEAYSTAWDASAPRRPPTQRRKGKWAHLLPTIPEGRQTILAYRSWWGEPLFGWRTRYWSFLTKLAANAPWDYSGPARSSDRSVPLGNRRLTMREMATADLPDNAEIPGARRRAAATGQRFPVC